MSFGEIYSESWWGEVNSIWGSIYPIDADGSLLLVSSTSLSVDDTSITSDQTQY